MNGGSASLLRRTAGQVTGRLVGVLAGAIASVFAARSLGVSGFGYLSLTLSIVGALGLITDAGLTQTVARELVVARSSMLSTLYSAAVVRLLIALPSTAVALAVALRFPGAARALCVIASLSLLTGVPMLLQSVLTARLRPDLIALAGLVQSALWVASAGLVLLVRASSIWLGLGYTGSMAAQTIVILLAARPYLKATSGSAVALGTTKMGRLIRSSMPVAVGAILWALYQRAPMYVAGLFSNARQVGVLGAGYRISDALFLLPSTFATVALPLIIMTRKSDATPGPLLRAMSGALVSCGLAISIAVFVGGEPLLRGMFGSGFAGVGVVAGTLALSVVPFSIDCCMGVVLISADKAGQLATSAAVALAAAAAGSLLIVPSWGALGAAVVAVAVQSVRAALLVWSVRNRLGLSRMVRWGPLAITVAVSGCVGMGGGWLLRPSHASLAAESALGLLAGALVVATALLTGLVRRSDLLLWTPAHHGTDPEII